VPKGLLWQAPAALGAVSDMSVDEFLSLVCAQGYALFLLQEATGLTRLDGALDLGSRASSLTSYWRIRSAYRNASE
jgi:hypothetical protein